MTVVWQTTFCVFLRSSVDISILYSLRLSALARDLLALSELRCARDSGCHSLRRTSSYSTTPVAMATFKLSAEPVIGSRTVVWQSDC